MEGKVQSKEVNGQVVGAAKWEFVDFGGFGSLKMVLMRVLKWFGFKSGVTNGLIVVRFMAVQLLDVVFEWLEMV